MGLIKVFDALYVDQLIQKNERGEAVVYPYGLAGSGYVLPEDRVGAVRTSMRRQMLAAIAIGFYTAVVAASIFAADGHVSLWTGLGVAAATLGFAGILYMQRRLATGLKQQVIQQRPSIGVFMRNARMARPLWSLWGELVLGVIVVAFGLPDLITALQTSDYTGVGQNLFILAVGGYILWDGALGVIQRRSARAA